MAGRGGKGKWEGRMRVRQEQARCKGIEACPFRNGQVTRPRRRFNSIISILRFGVFGPSTVLSSVSSYYSYLEIPSTHYVLHLHKPFHLSPSPPHLPHFPQIRHYVDKIGRRDQRS